MSPLPVLELLDDLRAALADAGGGVLSAPPGSGKTTALPPALLAEPWLAGRRILVLEPRRLAARAAAAHIAGLLAEPLGERVGYSVRFDTRVSPRTRIELVTEGVLTRRLQRDPELSGVGLVVFDELHERSLEADLALALVLDARAALRPDLRLLAMSATLDAEPVARMLGGVPVLRGAGRLHPVEVRYAQAGVADRELVAATVRCVQRALAEQGADVLVFLPGGREIRAVAGALRKVGDGLRALVCPLYGDLPQDQQDRAIRPDPAGRRRVVLATNIAETSLTIEGVGAVVDSGLARAPRFDPRTGLTRLSTTRVSRASAEQRAGRAGRLGPGVCYRLWTEAAHRALIEFTPAAILDADLSVLALELAAWGVADAGRLAWLDAPPAGAYASACELLHELGALDASGRITEVGRRMSELPVHPRLARMLLEAGGPPSLACACDLAAILEESDVIARAGSAPSVDLADRLDALRRWRGAAPGAPLPAWVDARACARVDRVARKLEKRLAQPRRDSSAASPGEPGALLAVAYPDRIARARDSSGQRYLLSSGRGLALPDGDPLRRERYLVVPSLDAGRREARAFLAAALHASDVHEVFGESVRDIDRIEWDESEAAVAAYREQRLGALVLERAPLRDANPESVRAAMLAGVRQMGIDCLPWNRAARGWQARVLSLRAWRPDEGWPDVTDDALLASLEEWLAPCLNGVRRREHLQRVDLCKALRTQLAWPLASRLEQGAPTHLLAPSGSRLALRYVPGEVPILEVRIQEMFGARDTPRVCWGEVPVVLHLLSPARRPVQVTRDLAGFWARGYAEVRKELKGRYPRHYWPDDPLLAEPTARAKPRRC